ncbi:MAG: apolipoprotein N-acyltransferase [Polyangiales bacterium]
MRITLIAAAALMLVLSFPRVSWTYLSPLAFIAIFWATHGLTVVRAGLAGYLCGIWVYGIGCFWLLDAIRVSQGRVLFDSLGPFLLSVLYHAAQFGLFTATTAWVRGLGARVPVVATASSWVLLEWLFPKFAHWSVGDVSIDWPLVPQIADVGGVAGVAFLIVATSATLYNFATELFEVRAPSLRPLVALALAYVVTATYGTARQRQFERPDPKDGLDVLIVQGALPVGDEDAIHSSAVSWRTYSNMTQAEDLAGVDIVFWPETTIRDYLRRGSEYALRLTSLAAKLGVNLVLGALDLPASGEGEYSAAYLIEPDGGLHYAHKRHLVPFGEYVPLQESLGFLTTWRTTGSFVPGVHRPNLGPDGAQMATSICIEATRPGFNHEQIRRGATMLANLSDDTWFEHSAVPYIHLQSTRWRALEARRWLVRSSNSGVSAVIDPTGRVVARIPYGDAGTVRATIYQETEIAPFVRWGHWFIWLSAFLWLFSWCRTLALVKRANHS